jgi:hypothetical protein
MDWEEEGKIGEEEEGRKRKIDLKGRGMGWKRTEEKSII